MCTRFAASFLIVLAVAAESPTDIDEILAMRALPNDIPERYRNAAGALLKIVSYVVHGFPNLDMTRNVWFSERPRSPGW